MKITSHSTNHATQISTEPSPEHAEERKAPSGTLLPRPASFASMDPMVAIAALSIEMSKTMRKSHASAADGAAAAEDAADRERIRQMEKKARDERIGGCLSGVGKMGSGVCNIQGGMIGKESAMKFWGGWGETASAGGDLGGTVLKASANASDRQIQEAERQSKTAKRAYDRLEKEVDAAKQHEGKLLQIITDIKKAQEQCEKAALMRA